MRTTSRASCSPAVALGCRPDVADTDRRLADVRGGRSFLTGPLAHLVVPSVAWLYSSPHETGSSRERARTRSRSWRLELMNGSGWNVLERRDTHGLVTLHVPQRSRRAQQQPHRVHRGLGEVR